MSCVLAHQFWRRLVGSGSSQHLELYAVLTTDNQSIVESFEKDGFNVQSKPLSFFYEDYGLKPKDGTNDEPDDEDDEEEFETYDKIEFEGEEFSEATRELRS